MKASTRLILFWAMSTLFAQSETEFDRKIRRLGLADYSYDERVRHIQIAEAKRLIDPGSDTPVHILFRPDDTKPWKLAGLGMRLGISPQEVLTAFNVFRGSVGQFGVRPVCPEMLQEDIPPIPVFKVRHYSLQGDVVICSLLEGSQFPKLEVRLPPGMSGDPTKDKAVTGHVFDAIVRFSTYPDIEIHPLYEFELSPGQFQMFIAWEPLRGECGTVATVDGWSPDRYVVVIRSQTISKQEYDSFPGFLQTRMQWRPDKRYAITVSVLINKK